MPSHRTQILAQVRSPTIPVTNENENHEKAPQRPSPHNWISMGRKRARTLQGNRQNPSASLASPSRRRTRSNAPRLAVEGTPAPLPHLLVRPPRRHPQVTDAGYDPIATPVFSTPREARKRRVSDTPMRPRRVSETPIPPAKKTSESPALALPPASESVLRACPVKRPRTQSQHDQLHRLPPQTPFQKNTVRPRRVSDTPLPSAKNIPSTPIFNIPSIPDPVFGTPQSMRPHLHPAGQPSCASPQKHSRRKSASRLRIAETPEPSAAIETAVKKSQLQRVSSPKPSRINNSTPFQDSAMLASPGLLSAHVSLTVESVFSYEDGQSNNKARSDRERSQKAQRRISFGVGTPQQPMLTPMQSAEVAVHSAFEAAQPLPSHRQHDSAELRLPPSRAPPSEQQCSQVDEQVSSARRQISVAQCRQAAESSSSSSEIQAKHTCPAQRQTKIGKRADVREVVSPADDSDCSWGAEARSPASSEVALFQQKKVECKHVPITERGRSPVVCEQSGAMQTDREATPSDEEDRERGAKWKSDRLTTQDFVLLKPRRVGQTIEDAINAAKMEVEEEGKDVEDVAVTQSSVPDSNVRSAQTNVDGDECSSTQSPPNVDRKEGGSDGNEKVQEAAVYCRSVLVSIPSGALLSPDGSD